MTKSVWFFVIAIFIAPLSYSDSVVVSGKGSTFVINKLEGFDGSIGAQREAVFVAAARVWADMLVSSVDITVDASFTSLTCDSSQAILGSAGPNSLMNIPSNASYYNLVDNLSYPIALANSLAGRDFNPSGTDITARFNASVDNNAACLNGVNWYYGLDHNPTGYDIDFFEVVLHELGHGIGILSFVDSNGSKYADKNDTYILNLKDETTGASWASMTQSEILASRTNTGNLVWTGSNVNALAHDLTEGVNNGQVQMYAPSTFSSGSSVSHFDTALSPNELMEPIYEGNSSYEHSAALLEDIGWEVLVSDNIAPVITAQAELEVNEDDALTISLSDLTVVDTDNSYPSEFTLTVFSGSNYTVSGSTIIPNQDYFGSLTVPVSVYDGESSSDRFDLVVAVNAINDAPTITDQYSITMMEDSTKTLSVFDLEIIDPDDSSFSISASSGDHYSVTNGNEITPDTNWFGSLVVPVVVNDGELDSAMVTVALTVTPVNDLPIIQMSPVISTDEDTRVELNISSFSVVDVDDITFSLKVLSGEHYSVSGSYIVPELNYNGSLSVGVKAFDGEGYSAIRYLSVDVNSINDAPNFNAIGSQQINSDESISLQVSATDIEGDALTYSLASAPSWLSISSEGLVTGTASYSDIGSNSVSVSVSDGSDSDEYTFNISVVDTASADLSVGLSASDALVNPNEIVTATLNIKQLGPVAEADVSATVDFDKGISLVTYDSRCTIQSTTQLLCTEANLLSSNTSGADFDIEFYHTDGQVVNIVATVASDIADPSLANNTADTSVIVLAEVDGITSAEFVAGSSSSQAVQVFSLEESNNQMHAVFANAEAEQSIVYEFDTYASMATPIFSFPSTVNSVDVLVDDFNNDSFLDILLVNNNSDSVLYLNNGIHQFIETIILGTSNASSAVSVDLNNDGYLDVVVANQNNEANDVYLNSSGNNLVLTEQLGSSDSSSIAVMDYNRDGYADIVVGNRDDDNYVYLNNGSDQSISQFSDVITILGSTMQVTNSIEVADLDGDGVANEIIIGNDTSIGEGSIEIFRIAENQSQTNVSTLDSGDVISISAFNQGEVVAFAALNRDGVVQLFEQQNIDDYLVKETMDVASGSDIILTELNFNNSIDLVVANSTGANQIFNDVLDYQLESAVDSSIRSDDSSEHDSVTGTEVSAGSTSTTKTSTGSLSILFILMFISLVLTRRSEVVRVHSTKG